MPRTLAKAIREIMPDAVPGKRLAEVTPAEFLQLMMRRHCGRAVAEAELGRHYLSDGSSLQEWAYGHARIRFGMNPTDPDLPNELDRPEMGFFAEVVEQYGHAFRQHVRESYDAVVHLENERPISADGHRPMNEEFRQYCDTLLRTTVEDLGIPLRRISGSLEDRVQAVVRAFDLPTVMDLEQAVALMEEDYARIDMRLETERQPSSGQYVL